MYRQPVGSCQQSDTIPSVTGLLQESLQVICELKRVAIKRHRVLVHLTACSPQVYQSACSPYALKISQSRGRTTSAQFFLLSFMVIRCLITHCAGNIKPKYYNPLGIYLGIYSLSIHALIGNTNTTRFHRNVYILFSSILLLLNTLSFVEWPYTGQMMWIKVRDSYPGGPLAYYEVEPGQTPVDIIGDIAQTIAATLNDSLLVSFFLVSTVSSEKFYLLLRIGISLLHYLWFQTIRCRISNIVHSWGPRYQP
jgi:hypothetical protein